MDWEKIKKISIEPELFDYDAFKNDILGRTFRLAEEILDKDIKKIQKKVHDLYESDVNFDELVDIVGVFISLLNKGFHRDDLKFTVERKSQDIFLKKIKFLLSLVLAEDLNINWIKFICTIEYLVFPTHGVDSHLAKVKSIFDLVAILKVILDNLGNAQLVSLKKLKNSELSEKLQAELSSMDLPSFVSGRPKNAIWNTGIYNMLDLYNFKGKLVDIERVGNGNTVFFLRKYVKEKFPNLTFYCLED